MVPDLPMFGLVPYSYEVAHSGVGIATVDLLAGIVVTAVWMLLVKDAVIDACPVWLRERVAGDGYARRDWMLLPLAVVLGSTTHVGWDEFTHAGRWGATHIRWLRADHFGYAGYHWMQAASSVLGLVVVVVVGWRSVAARTRRPSVTRAPVVARIAAVAVVGIAALVGCAYGSIEFDNGMHAVAIATVVHGIEAFTPAAVLAAFVWRVWTLNLNRP